MVTRLEEKTRIGKGGTLAGQLSRLDLVVLDELGYLPFARSGGQLSRLAIFWQALPAILI